MGSKRDVPEFYECAGCGRNLEVDRYSVGLPIGDVAEEKIYRVLRPNLSRFVLLCTCGHYTVVSPREPK